MSDLEDLIRKAMKAEGCKVLSIYKVEGGYQANRQSPKDTSAFRVEIMSDPADALFNALVPWEEKRKDPRKRDHGDLV